MSFSGFGNNQNQNAGGSGFSFGAKPATGFNFGAPATTSGGLFNTTNSSMQFGQPQQPAGGLAFGSQTQTTGFGFGQNTAQQPQQQPQPTLTFGQTPQQTTPAFGATPGNTGSTFGATVTQGNLSFGTTTTTTQAGLTFGNTSQQTTTPAFGLNPSTTNATPLQFGGPTTTSAPALNFGAPPITTTAPNTTTQPGLSFTTPATQSTGLTFGVTPAATAPVTIAPILPPPTTTTGLTFNTGGLNFKTTTTSVPPTTTTLTFGTSAPTGFTATTTSAFPSLLGFQTTKTTTSTGFSLNTSSTIGGGAILGGLGAQTKTTAVTSTTNSVGLGGVDTSHNKQGTPGSRTENNAVKENQIPNEIFQTIEGFKSFVKAQKSLSSDIARGSPKSLNKVAEDTEALKQLVNGVLSAGLQRNRTTAARLKSDTATCLHHAEMAQRTHDTPAGLQYDNTQPLRYFQEIANRFEQDMQLYRREIENTEKHIESLSQPFTLTPQELSGALKRLHASLVALAGRLQSVHTRTETEKVHYMTFRRNVLNDVTDVFGNDIESESINYGVKGVSFGSTAGPTPFASLGNPSIYGIHSQTISEQTPANFSMVNNSQLGWSSSLNQNPNLITSTPLLVQDPSSGGFQLAKPPLGNKRGKR